MDNNKYYAERKGILKPEPADFQLLKKVFLRTYREFKHDNQFEEAAGYDYGGYGPPGRWGFEDSDIKESVYLELGMDIWPIEENIEWYDEPTLFTVIEFL